MESGHEAGLQEARGHVVSGQDGSCAFGELGIGTGDLGLHDREFAVREPNGHVLRLCGYFESGA